MKRIMFALIGACCISAATAQPLAPDFTMTDMDGNSRHLYDMLNQGKPVYLYLLSPSSTAGWEYHNSYQLHEFYNEYGPNGSSLAMLLALSRFSGSWVLGFEGDLAVDWTEGTPYPIISNFDDNVGTYLSTLQDIMLIESGFSNCVLRICPDRSIIRLPGLPTAAEMAASISGCEVATYAHDTKLSNLHINSKPVCTEKRGASILLTNMGTQTLQTCEIHTHYNGSSESIQTWTGNLATYESDTVLLDSIMFWSEDADLAIFTKSPNGKPDKDRSNDTLYHHISGGKRLETDTLTVELLTDGYGPQLYWDIKASDGVTIDSGGNILVGMLDGEGAPVHVGTSYNDNFYLQKKIAIGDHGLDCIELRVLSGLGYGVCCDYGEGYIRFKQGDEVLYEFTDFGRRAYGKIFATWVDTKDVSQPQGLKVFPNPTDGHVTVQFELMSPIAMEASVINLTGQRVLWQPMRNFEMGQQSVVWDVSELPMGMYWAVLRHAGGSETVKFVVMR